MKAVGVYLRYNGSRKLLSHKDHEKCCWSVLQSLSKEKRRKKEGKYERIKKEIEKSWAQWNTV